MLIFGANDNPDEDEALKLCEEYALLYEKREALFNEIREAEAKQAEPIPPDPETREVISKIIELDNTNRETATRLNSHIAGFLKKINMGKKTMDVYNQDERR
jgi:hypothetical protein